MPDPVYAVFTDQERVKIRTALGYLSTGPVASIVLGVPASTQPGFLVEGAMDRLLFPAGPIVRDILCQIDAVEAQIRTLPAFAVASELGNMKLREDAIGNLQELRGWWVRKLSDVLGAPINPFSVTGSGGRSINRAVVNC